MKIHRINVKSTFLNGYIKEEVNVEQLKGLDMKGKEWFVYWLKAALYDLKQAPIAWHERIDGF